MATFPQRQTSALQSDQPKFCTIILHQEANYLKIEHEFARRHGSDLPRTVSLKVHASDKLWKLKVFKSENGEVLFKNGWEEFKQYYSVKLGDFLVFKFDRSSSIFDVFIYDMTSVHIDGAIDEEARSETNGGLGEVSESQKRRRDEMAFRQEQKSLRKRSKSAGDDDIDNSSIHDRAGGSRIFKTRTFTRQLSIHELYTLKLPKYFTEGIRASNYIMLKDVNGRELKVNLGQTEGKYSLRTGWKDFLVNNKVTIGSTLSFELVSVPYSIIEVVVVNMGADKNMLFEYVRKRGGKPYCVVPHGHSRENTGDHSKNKDTDNVTNQEGGSRSHANCSLRRQIPFSSRHRFELTKEFIRSTGINSHAEITLKNVKGRGWSVTNTCRTYSRCTFGRGWHKFLVDNKIIIGSTLEFKLVSKSPYIIEVRVVKPGANQNELFTYAKKSAARRQIVASNDHARGRKPRKGPTNVDSENDERSKQQENGPRVGSKWTFSRKVKAHHAYDMYIPKDFVRVTGIEAKSKIRLKLGKGKEWLVEVTSDKRRYRYSISTGWNDFVKDNKVLEGSTISFKYIPNSNNLVEVQVLKNGTKGKPLVIASPNYHKIRKQMKKRM